MKYVLVEVGEHGGIDKILSIYTIRENAQAVLDLIHKLSYHAEVKIIEQETAKEEE